MRKNKKIDKLLEYAKKEGQKSVIYLDDNAFIFMKCCDCGLRHVYHFTILTDDNDEKVIAMSAIRDEIGTELIKLYKKRNK